MKKYVLSIKIDDISMEAAVKTVDSWLSGLGKHYIVTPNPEFLVSAQSDSGFKKILNSADLAIPDGVGLKLAGVKNKVTGTDLMEKLCELASEKGYTIGLLGGEKGVAEKAAECLKKKNPKLKIAFAESGPVITGSGATKQSNTLIRLPRPPESGLAMTKECDLLFVAFGHPKQEYWIAKNMNRIPVKVVMGVGGVFDYISGKVPRAPVWIRNAGLEWLFRLIMQPWRIKRQLKLIKFIYYLSFKNLT